MDQTKNQDKNHQALASIQQDLKRMSSAFDNRFERLESLLNVVDQRLDSVERQISDVARAVEINIESVRNISNSVDNMDTDLKRFAKVANETALHYSEEIDKLRDRIDVLEP
jgi:methyl-accepting chemotaxis protein